MLTDNTLLLIAYFGLYFADCAVFLLPTQALITIKSASQPTKNDGSEIAQARYGWLPQFKFRGHLRRTVGLDFGLTFYALRGRFPAFLNPLTPFNPVFKTAPLWRVCAGKTIYRSQPLHRLMVVKLRTNVLGVYIIWHGALLFGFLPYLLLRGQTLELLLGLAVAFVSAGLIIAFCYPLRSVLRLTKLQFWLLSAQSLLCLPTSLNFPRKLGLLVVSEATAITLLERMSASERMTAAMELRTALAHIVTAEVTCEASEEINGIISLLNAEDPHA